jgi:hypothetical protein
MTVVSKNHNPTVVFRMSGYLYDDTSIHNDGQKDFTFTEFGRSTMVFLGPSGRVDYKRCWRRSTLSPGCL